MNVLFEVRNRRELCSLVDDKTWDIGQEVWTVLTYLTRDDNKLNKTHTNTFLLLSVPILLRQSVRSVKKYTKSLLFPVERIIIQNVGHPGLVVNSSFITKSSSCTSLGYVIPRILYVLEMTKDYKAKYSNKRKNVSIKTLPTHTQYTDFSILKFCKHQFKSIMTSRRKPFELQSVHLTMS